MADTNYFIAAVARATELLEYLGSPPKTSAAQDGLPLEIAKQAQ